MKTIYKTSIIGILLVLVFLTFNAAALIGYCTICGETTALNHACSLCPICEQFAFPNHACILT